MKIVYFAPIAYSDLKQRPQYLIEGLSEKHQICYIEPTVRVITSIQHKEDCSAKQKDITKNLTVFRCDGKLVLPFRWNVYDLLELNGLYEYMQLRTLIASADVLFVGYEGWYNVIKWAKNKKVIYDKMDENSLLSPDWANRTYLQRSERKLIERSTLMCVTARTFEEQYKKRLPTYLIPNAFEAQNVSYIPYVENRKDKKVYGYVGLIAEWFDNKAVELIAENENNTVVLVGPCRTEKIKKDNVIYVGKVEKKEVAAYIKSFDICLYPFKKGKLLDTINPVKIYEYLSFNKPVIAVNNREMEQFQNGLYTYENYDQLQKLCEDSLTQPFMSQKEYETFIEKNSWDDRIEKLNKILEELES